MTAISNLSASPRPRLHLVPDAGPVLPRGEVCVLLDPDRTVVWLHGEVDGDLADDLADAAEDCVEAGLPVLIQASRVSACDGTALLLVSRLLAAGVPVRLLDPEKTLTRALQRAVHPANRFHRPAR